MARFAKTAIVPAVAASIVAGCQAFLSFGANDDRPTDGGADASAAVDAAPSDGDLDSGQVVASRRFCDGIDATFCADFDDDAGSIELGWGGYVEQGGGQVKRDDDHAKSPPSSLAATGPGDGGNGIVTTSMRVKNSIVVELELSPRKIPNGDPSSALDLRVLPDDGGVEQRFHLYVYAGLPARVQQWIAPGTFQDYVLSRSIPTDDWTHVRLEIDLARSRIHAALGAEPDVAQSMGFAVSPGTLVIELGLPYASHDGPSKVNVDNLVVYAR